MPVYNYVCSECGARFEQKHSFDEADLPVICPVVFKGSGFYVTDHRANAREKGG